jgi:uncharacterized repeat protein (TIGR01451 family)
MSTGCTSDHEAAARGPAKRTRAVRALLLGLVAIAAMAIGAPAASAQPWPCDAYGYLFQYYGPTDLDNAIVQVDLATGTQTPVATPPGPLNGVGYNELDGYYYAAMRTNPVTNTWTMVRVHSDGTTDDLGIPIGTTLGAGGWAIGDVGSNGHYWILVSTGGGAYDWYEVDLVPGSPTYGQLLDSGTATVPGPLTNAGADWTWINGALYSVGGDAANNHYLVRFNPATGTFSNLGLLPAPFPSGTNGSIGATFADAAGYLYASANATNTVWRINPTTRQVIMSAPPPAGVTSSPGNDGARCGAAVVPTITVTKTVAGRVRSADQFTVSLRRPDGSLADSATTSGSGTTASTVNVPASQGKTYSITDAMAAGSASPLSEYAKSIVCKDASGNTAPVGGSGPSWTLNVANATNYTCNVTNKAQSDLEIEKSASPTPAVPGTNETYSLKVTNHGPSTAINAKVSDFLPSGLSFVSASSGCSEANKTVTCTAASIDPGASQTFTVAAKIASSVGHCDDLRNKATVSSDIFDPDTSNNESEICPDFKRKSDLSMKKTASQTQVNPGGQLMYTLVVHNDGPSDTPGARVTDPMAQGLTLVSAKPSQGSCSTAGNQLVCDLGALKAAGSAQVLVTAQVGTALGNIQNTACIDGDNQDPNSKDNCDSSTITVVPGPEPKFDLVSTKTAASKSAYVGQPLKYTITVTNKGPDAAPSADVTDTLNSPASVVSVRASQGTCTKSIPMTCQLGTVKAGAKVTISVTVKLRDDGCKQRNAASTTGDGTDNNPANNLARVDVCAKAVPLKLTKVADSGSVRAGGTLAYTIKVTNPTKGEAQDVDVCDRLPSGMVYVSSQSKAKFTKGQYCWHIETLAAHKSRSFRITVRLLGSASGDKVNRATANGQGVKAAVARDPVHVLPARASGGGVTG